MALRTRYSSLDMVRMAKFAKENPDLKPIPLIKAYNKKYPEISEEQKLKNIRNWLDDNGVMAVAESSNECEALPIQRVSISLPDAIEKIKGYEKEALKQAGYAKRDGADISAHCSEAMAFAYKLSYQTLEGNEC